MPADDQPVYLRPPERLYPPGYAQPPGHASPGQGGPRKTPKYYFVNPFKVSPFLKLLTKRQGPSTVRSKQWALKIIAEVYEARFQALKDPHWRRIRTASFVHDLLSRRYGVKSIVDKMCWELYQTLQKMRMEDKELDIFGWFLDELYDGDDLTFFVEARQKVLWSQEVEKEDMVSLSALGLRPDQVNSLVSNIFGNGAPLLSDRVVDRVNVELVGGGAVRPLTVSNFLDIALEEFRLHFDKAFPKIEALQDQAENEPLQQPSPAYAEQSDFQPSRTAPPARAPRESKPPRESPAPASSTQAPLQPRDATVSEWQFPLIVELREQLVKKNQRIYELEEKLLAQGEGRAKVEAQLRQLKHQASQMNRDAASEREWVEQFLRDAGYEDVVSKGDGDYGSQLMMVFDDKQAQIDDLSHEIAQLEERNRLARSSMQEMGKAGDDLLRLQDENHKLQSTIEDLSGALEAAEAAREDTLMALEKAQMAGAQQAKSPAREQKSSPRPEKAPSPARSPAPVKASPRASAAPAGGAAGNNDLTTNMLSRVINELEKNAKADKAKNEQMEARLKELEREFENQTTEREQAEEAVMLLEDENKQLTADLAKARGMLTNLETQEQSRFEAALAEERAQHQEQQAAMKQQMAGVMEKVMKEWDRVKKAARKSVSVEEWLRLEDDLKRAEKKNEELLAQRDAGGGGAPGGAIGGAPVEAADPDVYGRTMANVIDDIENKTKALKMHGDNWRAHGDVTSPAEVEMKKAVDRLYSRYDLMESRVHALDKGVEQLAEAAASSQIPEVVVERLARVIKDGLEEVKNVREIKTSPEEVVMFMERVLKLTDALGKQLEEAERDYQEKSSQVIESEREGRLIMQDEVSKMRAAIKSVPETLRPKVFSPEFLSWFERAS